jgi:heme-degrading monooxygenase HmoA
MYAVIFKAEIKLLDDDYSKMAIKMRDLALNKYGCTEFTSTTEGNQEISISYWQDQQQIKSWKEDSEHLLAQKIGQNKWYKSYQVQVVEIIREYKNQ